MSLDLQFKAFKTFVALNSTSIIRERSLDSEVISLNVKESHIKAEVKGTSVYKVDILYNPVKVETAVCTCPYSFSGICKHIVLVLIQADELLRIQNNDNQLSLFETIDEHTGEIISSDIAAQPVFDLFEYTVSGVDFEKIDYRWIQQHATNPIINLSSSIMRSSAIMSGTSAVTSSVFNLANGLTNSDVQYPSDTTVSGAQSALNTSLFMYSSTPITGGTTGTNGSTTTGGTTGSNGSTTTGGTTEGSGSSTTGGTTGSNGSTPNNNNSTGTDAATNEEKKSSNILGGSVGSIQNSTSGGGSPTKGNAPTIVLSSDFAGFNFKSGDATYGGKGTAGWTSLNWDGTRSHGFMLDYTSANKGPNFTAFYASIKKRRIDLISVTGTTSFYGKGSLYGTVALGQMWSFPKVKNLKAIYMATSSYGNVYGTKFIGTAFIAGGMYDFKIGKRTQIKLTNLFIYAPYISYYNDMVLKSPYVIMPIIGTNIGVTKKFKLNVNFGGTYALGENVLNFTVMMGTRFAL